MEKEKYKNLKEYFMDLKLLTLEETADFLRVKRRYLQELRKQDGFPKPVVLGKKKICFLASDIHDWVVGGGASNV